MFTLCSANISHARESVQLSLPESVLAEAITATLPIEYTPSSQSLQGKIRVINISDFQIVDQHLACRLHLAGDGLKIVTKVAGHKINVNVGSVELDFKTKAALRFDEKQQILFITPVIEEVASSKDAGGGEIGKTIVQLLDGNEFPISLEDLDPIITRVGAKTLTVTTRVADITAKEDWLLVLLNPTITANK